MGTLHRRAGAQKHPLRTRRRSLQRRRVKAVLSEYQEKASTDYKRRSSEVDEDEEAALAWLMPSTWRSKSVCDADADKGTYTFQTCKHVYAEICVPMCS